MYHAACIALSLMLWKCGECNSTNYCSARCQREDWTYVHGLGECESTVHARLT